jgi:predicted O-methyltransferase YrrM
MAAMSEHRFGPFERLTAGIPAAPGLGQLSERMRTRGLATLTDEHARLLAFLAGERGVLRTLVAGRAAEHAAACVAHAAPMAQVLVAASEVDAEALSPSSGADDRVQVVATGAGRGLEETEGGFDLIHIDEEVAGYRRLLDLAMTRASVQGVIVLHGLPAEGSQADVARAFCGYLMMHPQLRSMVLPIGEGLAISRKAQPLVTDLGGPY